jgi:hypothetical protein
MHNKNSSFSFASQHRLNKRQKLMVLPSYIELSKIIGRCWLYLFRGERKEGERKAGWPGFLHSGKERARKKGESGKAGVPSQWEGTGQEEREKAGKPGFPRNGRERARKKWRKRECRGSLAMGGNGPGRKEKAGKPVFPRNGRERARGSILQSRVINVVCDICQFSFHSRFKLAQSCQKKSNLHTNSLNKLLFAWYW